MKYTTNFNLKKPEQTDFYNVDDFNENYEAIDAELKNRKDEQEKDAENITGLINPTFDDSGTTEGISSFPDFLSRFKSKVNIFQWFRDFKAGAQFILHAGQIVNNCVTNNPDLPLSAAQGKILMDMIIQQNSDFQGAYLLKGGVEIPEAADMKSDTYKIPGNYYCSKNSSVATLLNCPVNSAFTLKVEYSAGTGYPKQVFRDFCFGQIIVRTYDPYQNKWFDEVSYIRDSDLGKVIINTGDVTAVKGQKNEIATITLPAGHKYLILSSTEASIGEGNYVISCGIDYKTGTANTQLGLSTTRTTMIGGGGCVNWRYVETVTDCVFAVTGYGYADANYDYSGRIIAIQLD